MGKYRKPNRTGRNKASKKIHGLFLALPHSLVDSAAFRGLSSAGKIVVIAIGRAHNFEVNDNGKIPFGERAGAAWGLSQKTTRRALIEAEATGLIRKMQSGTFTSKRLAAQWAISWWKLAPDAIVAKATILSSGKNAQHRGKDGRYAPRLRNEIGAIEAKSTAKERTAEAA